MDKAETVAEIIVETLMRGAKMRYRETQSAGEYDFDLVYATGMSVPLEVTMSTDQPTEAIEAAIMRSRKGGSFVQRIHCQHDWWVHPTKHARINKIRTYIDSYLAAIEAEGWKDFDSFIDAADSPAIHAILQDLQIEGGNVTKWKSPGIEIATPGDGGLVDPALVNEAVEIEALKDDNKRKLGSAEASEKHLFVYVTHRKYLVWVAVRDGVLPASPPKLPTEITHVWVATWAGDGGWHTVWRASREDSWTHMGLVNIDTGEVTNVKSALS